MRDRSMPYYIRVLGKSDAPIPVEDLRHVAKPAVIDFVSEDTGGWTELLLRHEAGLEIAAIEKNPVIRGQLGADELQEFIDEVAHYRPQSAATWLRQYLPSIKVIYAFQVLSGTEVHDGWGRLHAVFNAVWNLAGGIFQADGEGFSNEAGFSILWQFSDTVNGPWDMAVIDQDGCWIHFEMDLGNPEHRTAFWRGEIPAGARLL